MISFLRDGLQYIAAVIDGNPQPAPNSTKTFPRMSSELATTILAISTEAGHIPKPKNL